MKLLVYETHVEFDMNLVAYRPEPENIVSLAGVSSDEVTDLH